MAAKGAYIESEILESKAFLSLKGVAPQVFLLFMLKRQFSHPDKRNKKAKRICLNADSLSLTYIEAEKRYGISQPRFTRAIDELLEKGFLSKRNPGGGYQKDKATYALSDRYLFWKRGQVCEMRRKDPVKRGFRKPKKDTGSQTTELSNPIVACMELTGTLCEEPGASRMNGESTRSEHRKVAWM